MRKGYFKEDNYKTPSDTPRMLFDKLMLGSRWAFIIKFVQLLFRDRKSAFEGKYDTKTWADSSHDIFKLMESCGGKFDIAGIQHLHNSDTPVVYICNHMSTLETVIFPGLLAPVKETTFIVKESLVRHKVFAPIMKARSPIVVERKDPRADFKAVMEQGKDMLSRGISVVIFPQSKRNLTFVPEEFNTLGVKLAKAAGAQVVPMAIKTDFWENGALLKDLGPIYRDRTIHIEFGEPFYIEGNGKKEHTKIIEFIQAKLESWQGGKG